MKAYSMGLRQRVLCACDGGEPTGRVAQTFDVSPAWVRRLKQHRRERGGDVAPRTGGGSRGRKIDRGRLAALVVTQPDATLVERRDRLGVAVTLWSICRALQAPKLTYKKSLPAPPSRTAKTWLAGGPRGA